MTQLDDHALLDIFVDAAKSAMQSALDALSNQADARLVSSPTNASCSGATLVLDAVADRAALAVLRPNGIRVLSEESGWSASAEDQYFAILDPVDGTKNAVRDLPFFSVSIAGGAIHKSAARLTLKQVAVGVVLTSTGGLYTAVNGASEKNGRIIRVANTAQLQDSVVRPCSLLWVSSPTVRGQVGSLLYLGSTAIELSLLAEGKVDVFVETKCRKIFDFAAGVPLVRGAGGVIESATPGEVLDDLDIDVLSRSTVIAGCSVPLVAPFLES